MKLRNFLIGLFLAIALACQSAYAVDWTNNGSGNWHDDSYWSGTHPNSVGAIADFSTIDITNNRTVTLDTNIITGNMIVGDTSGTSQYTFSMGAGSLTFDGGGNSYLSRVSGGKASFQAVVLGDNLIVNNSSSSTTVEMNSGISGPGGLIVNTGFFDMRDGGGTYTGETIVNNDSILRIRSNVPNGAFTVNDNGRISGYYTFTLNKNLGTGTGSIRFTGGLGTTSGFEWNNSMNVVFYGNSSNVVQWDGGHFDMETMIFKNTGGTLKVIDFQNILDLNGGTRTVEVVTSGTDDSQQYAKFSGEIQDTVGNATFIKTGAGRLMFDAVHTYSGSTRIVEGTLYANQVCFDDDSDIYVSSGAELALGHGGTDIVDRLYYEGDLRGTIANETWGGYGSGADQEVSWITGTGKIQITTPNVGNPLIRLD